MASPHIYPGGFNLAGTVFSGGPSLLAYFPSYLSGGVQWLDTIGGSNLNAGTEPELPVATIAQAVTNSGVNGTIIIGANSAENLAASQALSVSGLSVIGCGTGSSMPRYKCTGAGFNMFSAGGSGVCIQNIYFPASTAIPTSRVSMTVGSGEVRDCVFECGASDTGSTLIVGSGSSSTRIRNCAFNVTAARPGVALDITTPADVVVENCTVSGGSYGWAGAGGNGAAVQVGAVTRFRVDNLQLTNRSDFVITTTGATYRIYGLTNDGTSRVDIAA